MWQRAVQLWLVAHKNCLRLVTGVLSAIVLASPHFRIKIYVYFIYLHGISLLKLPSNDTLTRKHNLDR